jgi:hypothetical protein
VWRTASGIVYHKIGNWLGMYYYTVCFGTHIPVGKINSKGNNKLLCRYIIGAYHCGSIANNGTIAQVPVSAGNSTTRRYIRKIYSAKWHTAAADINGKIGRLAIQLVGKKYRQDKKNNVPWLTRQGNGKKWLTAVLYALSQYLYLVLTVILNIAFAQIAIIKINYRLLLCRRR